MCIALCLAFIVHVHSTSTKMSKVSIHFGVHDHPMSNGTCCKLLDMSYERVVDGVM